MILSTTSIQKNNYEFFTNYKYLRYNNSNHILTINSNFPPSCSGLVPGNGIWYKFIGNDAILSVSTSNLGTNFDTQIHIYEGLCDSLNLVGCDNNSGIGNTSQFSFLTTQGVEYYIYVMLSKIIYIS